MPRPLPFRPAPPVTDDVARARDGDAAAFARLYAAHAGRVHALCLRLSRDAEEARELTQDTFVRVWEKLPLFRGESTLGTWIHRTAVNVVLERRRSERRRLARVEARADLDALPTAFRRAPVDERMDLDAALARLSLAARTVFVLHEMEGYGFAEIAELTGTGEATLRSQLHRARRQLLALLRP
jgi:RNA polymerase sigma-70 factor (ECF subfamily)